MNPSYVSALAALSGASVGALASFATTWLAQSHQQRARCSAAEATRREKLFVDFIECASALFADAIAHGMEDPQKLVPLYALVSRIRLFASPRTITAAEGVASRIAACCAPDPDRVRRADLDPDRSDPLRDFTEACRSEMRSRRRKLVYTPVPPSRQGVTRFGS